MKLGANMVSAWLLLAAIPAAGAGAGSDPEIGNDAGGEMVVPVVAEPDRSKRDFPDLETDDPAEFWAFRPVAKPRLPAVRDRDWLGNPIDAFVLARLEAKGLVPVRQADRRTLIRRATFDLTGLPPSSAEIDAFIGDRSPAAFAVLVDRLLASPAYGERWGRHWLDVARYADTAGDGADYPVREAVKYRDWVIDAFNSDQPYDEFVREQIAGDILAARGPEELYAKRVTATGFLAIGKRYGYRPSPAFQHLDFADAIDSVGRSLLGLSLGCARCHDHKHDPVSAADYYALYGIFQSTRWAFPGGEEQKRPSQFPPLVPHDEAVRRDQAKATEIARFDAEIARLKRERTTLDETWFAGGADLGFEGQTPGKPPTDPWLSAGPNTVTTEAQSPFAHTHPAGTRGVHLESGAPNEGIRYVFEDGLRAEPGKRMHFTIDFRTTASGQETGAYRFYLGRGVVESLAVECSVTRTEFAIRNGTDWEVVRSVQPGVWYTLRLTLDPEAKTFSGAVGTASDLTQFEDKALGPRWDGIADTFICDAVGHVAGPASARDLDNIGLQETAFGEPNSGPVPPRTLPPNASERLAEVNAQLDAATRARAAASMRSTYPVAYGVSEGTPVNARIHRRGEPDKPGAEVPRRFLEALGGDPLPPGNRGSGRLELAHWITRPGNPLTPRVFVNRVWQWHFGRGLVGTPSDFGVRGDRPSHPLLLDWLASEFVASGWSVKSLHRLIMLSQTYQLAGNDHAANLRADPENRWLWRHSRRVLDAESIRDAMLALGGRLDRSIAPPHPFPPVNSWNFTIHNPFHAVYESNHRSVYLMVQRNRRHPFLALFDAADPNLSVAGRQPTTTPPQTLFLMNSPFVHEQSRGFARRLLQARGSDADRIRLACAMAQGRASSDDEVAAELAFLSAYQQELADQGVPEAGRRTAAWAALARVLLTGNAFLYVD